MGGSLDLVEVFTITQKAGRVSPKVFVETGTYQGQTSLTMARVFDKVYTIEIAKHYYEANRDKFAYTPNISAHLGDTKEVLPKLCQEIQEPIFFFLDAHWSSGDTGRGDVDVPLFAELKSIHDRHNPNDVIVIDDYRLFGTKLNEDWSQITEESLLTIFGSTPTNHWVHNDRLIITIDG